jgi:hypothetical protein
MLTWFQAWPFLATPFLLISLLAALPTVTLGSRTLGGAPFREWFLNLILLPLLPTRFEDQVLSWFSSASTLNEWLIVALVALNLNAILLPALYWIIENMIRLSGWITRKSLSLKTDSVQK